jgi:hypothetical protein
MALTDPLKRILLTQKGLIKSLEQEISDLESSNLVTENQKLQTELQETLNNLTSEKYKNQALSTENSQVKNALYEQIYNEKMVLLNNANKKTEVYFQSKTQKELNRLKAFEKTAREKIDEMTALLHKNKISAEDEIYKQLSDLDELINKKVTIAQNEFATTSGAFSAHQKEELQSLQKEQVSKYELNGVLKKNNLESLIGLNILSKVGILFLIIAVIALSRLAYLNLTDVMKGILIFAFGGILLGAGEWLNQKKVNIFSIALTSGGTAILYVAASMSFFTLEIIEFPIALLLIILITFLALVLSLRYNAQTITVFALIGGFLPVVTIAEDPSLPFIMMGYFFLLNLFLLLIATKKKWTFSAFLGFFFNISATLYIMKVMIYDRAQSQPFSAKDLITLLYILLVFLIYTIIPLVSTYRKKLRFTSADIFLLGFNTLISVVLMNLAFVGLNLKDYLGLLAIVFALSYLILGWWMEYHMPAEKLMPKLFYLTGFAFVVLFIPYQFDRMYLSLGWLVEGLVLAVYGILQNQKSIKWGGIFICTLCLFTFIFLDVAGFISNSFKPVYLFSFKYFAITLGSILILTSLAIKKTLQGDDVKLFKYITMVNFWVFSLYMIQVEWYNYLFPWLAKSSLDPKYLIVLFSIVITLLIAYILPRIKLLTDFIVKMISLVLYVIATIWIFVLNSIASPCPFGSGELPLMMVVAGTVVLLMIGLLSVLAVSEVVKALVVEKILPLEYYPMLVSTYFVVILTQNLISQYHLEFQNFVISLIYIITALLWILYGFSKRFALIRRFGLGLSILAIAKLVFIDLHNLNPTLKIVSYFAFGFFLLAISFVYQHFNKRLELNVEVVPNEKKDID